jgi:hypothetical protein
MIKNIFAFLLLTSCGTAIQQNEAIIITGELSNIALGKDTNMSINQYSYTLKMTDDQRYFFAENTEVEVQNIFLETKPSEFKSGETPSQITISTPYTDQSPQQFIIFKFKRKTWNARN